ncbi:MAG: hypothetical protein ACJA0U_001941 [Salibacteraceae bacterium]
MEWHSVRKAPKAHDTVETERGKTESVKIKNEALNETKIASSEIDSSSSRKIEKAAPEDPVLIAKFESTEEIDSASISDDDQLSERRNFSFRSSSDFFKELSFNKKPVSKSKQKANKRRREGKGLLSLGLIIMSIGIFFFLSVMIAWANFSFIQFNSILGAILYILFALVGYVLILVFGLINAVIISLCIAATGGTLAIAGWMMNR